MESVVVIRNGVPIQYWADGRHNVYEPNILELSIPLDYGVDEDETLCDIPYVTQVEA